LAGSDSEYLTVATTRPETMFVDTNLVVNPKDARFKKYLGKSFVNPVNGELLPLISDESIEIEFGTGVMKCTPAHAFDDYKIAIKHKIKKMNSCISRDGKLNNYAKNKYMDLAGVDRIEARTQIVAILNNLGLLVKAEPHLHNVGFSERSGEVVEPLFSMQ
jgi:valyl-tRNA synthetase